MKRFDFCWCIVTFPFCTRSHKQLRVCTHAHKMLLYCAGQSELGRWRGVTTVPRLHLRLSCCSYPLIRLPLPSNAPLEYSTPVAGYSVPPPPPSSSKASNPRSARSGGDEHDKARWVSSRTNVRRIPRCTPCKSFQQETKKQTPTEFQSSFPLKTTEKSHSNDKQERKYTPVKSPI